MKLLIAILLVAPMQALAHEDKIEMAAQSTTAALEKFKAEETTPAQSFSGVKTWLAGEDAKVRVYYNENRNSLVYTCAMHHGSNREVHLMCSKD